MYTVHMALGPDNLQELYRTSEVFWNEEKGRSTEPLHDASSPPAPSRTASEQVDDNSDLSRDLSQQIRRAFVAAAKKDLAEARANGTLTYSRPNDSIVEFNEAAAATPRAIMTCEEVS